MLNITVVTLFPDLFKPFAKNGLMGRAISNGAINLNLYDLRNDAVGKGYRRVDDYLFGGGAGLLLRADVLKRALNKNKKKGAKVIAMAPAGFQLNRDKVVSLSAEDELIIFCGRYEGFDQRFIDDCVDECISIGDFVLMGGELPAMVLIEAVARRFEGVLGSIDSALFDSFEDGLLEGGHYTRPAEIEGNCIPGVLTSGHHAKIDLWRRKSQLHNTIVYRPDLLKKAKLSGKDREMLLQIYKEHYCGSNKRN